MVKSETVVGRRKWSKLPKDRFTNCVEVWRRVVPMVAILFVDHRDSVWEWRIHTTDVAPCGTAPDLDSAMCTAEDVLLGLLLRTALALSRDKELREAGPAPKPGAGGQPSKS